MGYRFSFQLAIVAFVVLSALSVQTATAQEIDDLFGTPDGVTEEDANGTAETVGEQTADDEHDPDTVIPDADGHNTNDTAAPPIEESTDAPVNIAALTTSPTNVTGSLTTTAGASVGVNEWPWTDVADEQPRVRRYTAGYTMKASVTVDSRPAPYLRIQTTLSTSLDENSLNFPSPEVDTLFVDYTLADALFFRAGKFSMGWGRARLFDSPANLVSRVDDGAALRASIPAGPGSITGVVYSLPTWIAAYEAGKWQTFAFAGQWERTVGPVSFELSSHWQTDETWQNAAVFTLGIRELTLAGEVGYDMDQDRPGVPGEDTNAIAWIGNFFWETPTRAWSFWGEYSYQSYTDRYVYTTDDDLHRIGLAMRGPSVTRTGQWRPGLSWRHALHDDSGQVIVGMEGTVAPSLTMSLGVPLFYGQPGTTYRGIDRTRVNPDDDNLTDDEDDVLLISGDNVISFGLGFSLSFSF